MTPPVRSPRARSIGMSVLALVFLLLFGWAVLHGMFRDIEKPKYQMLANERQLDEELQEERSNGREEEFHYDDA